MALAGAKLFVDEGAHVFVSGRRQDVLDEAVELIGRNVTGVQGDSADLDDLDRASNEMRNAHRRQLLAFLATG
jgi:short-subunit dehydrogenase involved in D-alanine esterification of teichoic acids